MSKEAGKQQEPAEGSVGVEIFSRFVSYGGLRIISAGFSFFLLQYLARSLSSSSFGEYATIFTLLLFLTQIPLLGLHLKVIKDCAADPEQPAAYLYTGLIIAIPSACLLGMVLWQALPLVYAQPTMRGALPYVALTVIPLGILAVFEAAFTGLKRLKTVALLALLEVVARLAGSVYLVSTGHSIPDLFELFLLSKCGLVVSYLIVWMRMKAARPGPGPSTSAVKQTLSGYIHQVPVFAGIMLLSALILRIDTLWLSWIGDMEQVGLYAAPYKLYEVALMVPGMMAVVLLTVFSGLVDKPTKDFQQTMSLIVRVYLIGGILPLMVVVALRAPLVGLVFGDSYIAGADVLAILAVAVLVSSIDQVIAVGMLAASMQKYDFQVLAISLIVLVAGLALMIPPFGARGAAAAVLLAAVVRLVARSVVFFGKRKVFPFEWRMFHPVFFLVALFWVLSVLAGLSSTVAITVMTIAYPLYLVGSGAVSKDELYQLTRLRRNE